MFNSPADRLKKHLCNDLLLLQKFGNGKRLHKAFLAAELQQGATLPLLIGG